MKYHRSHEHHQYCQTRKRVRPCLFLFRCHPAWRILHISGFFKSASESLCHGKKLTPSHKCPIALRVKPGPWARSSPFTSTVYPKGWSRRQTLTTCKFRLPLALWYMLLTLHTKNVLLIITCSHTKARTRGGFPPTR